MHDSDDGTPTSAVLAPDTTAFVEEIAVVEEDKRAAKRRQRATKAHLDVLQAALDLRLTEQVLAGVEHDLANRASLPANVRGRRFRLGWRGASLEADAGALRARVNAMRTELAAKRDRAKALEAQADEHEARRPTAKLYRLHSEGHYVTYSEREYTQLCESQRTVPVRITESKGMWWWWYSDRFWWDNERLRAEQVRRIVFDRDRETMQQSDENRRSLAIAVGEMPAVVTVADTPIPELVRQTVWRRDEGRCVDCGAEADLVFDVILPVSRGGSVNTPNIELRCTSCRQRDRARAEKQVHMSRPGRPIS